ncbi:MAG: type II toxin-antitoxin system Phd/YefM family antitoxin [Cyanobacteria bacterium CRU_2_1]|nr:type II toxin-antitoxin system Phd/YefM family antitoxin [Cyanobacteria bacterium CRU_2_1]
MKTIEISEVASFLENYGRTEQPLILTRNGQPVAALFPVEEDVDVETFSLSVNPEFIKIIEQSRKSQREEGRVFLEDLHIPSEP